MNIQAATETLDALCFIRHFQLNAEQIERRYTHDDIDKLMREMGLSLNWSDSTNKGVRTYKAKSQTEKACELNQAIHFPWKSSQ